MTSQSTRNDIDRVGVEPRLRRAAWVGRALIALLCWSPMVGVYVTVVILRDAHLQDPAWPVHARFHLLWALTTPVIVGLAVFYIVVRHWPRLSSAVRAAICVIIAAWYLGEAIAYFVIAPLYLQGDPVAHAEAYVVFPHLKVALVIQVLLALAVALAYYLDRKYNQPESMPSE
jgi:hypothetical protein